MMEINNRDNQDLAASALLFHVVEGKDKATYLSIFEILHILKEKGFSLFMILFSFPMAIPLPYPPGFTTILGTPLLFFAFQMLLGREEPWLPEWVGNKKIKVEHLDFAITKALPYFKKLEALLKPRMLFISSDFGKRLIGLMAFACSISIVLPIWFGNAIPSAGIFLLYLGLLERDGLAIIIGYVTSIIGLIIAAAVVMVGVKAFQALIGKMINFIGF